MANDERLACKESGLPDHPKTEAAPRPLQKSGATKDDVIVAPLLLSDFTVGKIMLSAVVTGMIGTLAGAVGNGCLDALVGGLVGIVIGSGRFPKRIERNRYLSLILFDGFSPQY